MVAPCPSTASAARSRILSTSANEFRETPRSSDDRSRILRSPAPAGGRRRGTPSRSVMSTSSHCERGCLGGASKRSSSSKSGSTMRSGSSIGRCKIAAFRRPETTFGTSADELPSVTTVCTRGWVSAIWRSIGGIAHRAMVPMTPRRTSPLTS